MFEVLPFHPVTGLQAIGIGKRGPIWPIMGGSEDEGHPALETDDEGVDDGGVSAPESSGWWSFKSKDDAAKWANEIVEKRLARERKKIDPIIQEHATLKSEVEELRPLRDASLTDAQRWEAEKAAIKSELEELRSFKTTAERTNLIREIAEEKGLPARFISRVRGENADDITADIEELLNVLEDGKPAKKPAPQRKPQETDGDKPGTKGYSGGGSEGDGEFSVDAILKKVRENRGSTYAH